MESTSTLDSKTVTSEVRAFIVDNFLFGENRPFEDDESFLQTGLIDSTGIMELVQFIEDTYGLRVQDDDMTPENLDSLRAVSSYVVSRATAGK